MYQIFFSKQASKDKNLLKQAGLEQKAKAILKILMADPFQKPPSYEKLLGDLSGLYSRRVNRQHRIVYSVDNQGKTVKILRMWTHYEL